MRGIGRWLGTNPIGEPSNPWGPNMRTLYLLTCSLVCAGLTLAQAGPLGEAYFKPWGLFLNYIDASVKPGDNFFLYANGNWLKHQVIPADRTYSGVNLELDRQNEDRLKGLAALLARTPDEKLTAEQRK